MSVLLLTADLMTASKVSAAAQRGGYAFETAASSQALIDKAQNQRPALVIVDLTLPGLDIASLVPALRKLEEPPRAIIAFGPHVHVGRLAAAQQAGCDDVFARGQFHGQLDEILRRNAGGEHTAP